MAKLVKLTSNIDLDLPFLTSDPETPEGEPIMIFYSEHSGVINIEIG